MNGHSFEIQWVQGTNERKVWADDDECARFVAEALKLHPPVESVRVVSLLHMWERKKKSVQIEGFPAGFCMEWPEEKPVPVGFERVNPGQSSSSLTGEPGESP